MVKIYVLKSNLQGKVIISLLLIHDNIVQL